MRRIVIITLVVLVVIGGSLWQLHQCQPRLKSGINSLLTFFRSLATTETTVESGKTPVAEEPEISQNTVTLHLANKSSISGELVRETPKEVVILWKDGEITFDRGEIEQLEYGKTAQEEEGLLFPDEKEKWPYQNEVAIQLTNLAVLDGRIEDVAGEKVVIKYALEDGGSIEQDIERGKIEQLLFRPVDNEESLKIEENLKLQFPKMGIYRAGLFTIFTDSPAYSVKKYEKVLREHISDFYFTYFPLLKDRKSAIQNFVVIFDDLSDYIGYASTDGVPGWVSPGYFSPTSEALYLYNLMGADMDQIINEVILAQLRQDVNKVEEFMKQRSDERYHIFIEGMSDELKGKCVKIINLCRRYLVDITYMILRHEATHELFHNWRLQSIVISKTQISEDELAKKKKEYIETEDISKKRELLFNILGQKETAAELHEEEAANSWFVEGTAAYSEVSPVGIMNDHRLYSFQEARRKEMLLPLEQLTVYEMGSFRGVSSEPMLFAYGQSWAFTYFLMKNYRGQFLSYLERMAKGTPSGEDDLMLLLESLGRDLREIEKEFLAFMEPLEEVGNPDIELKLYDEIYKTFY